MSSPVGASAYFELLLQSTSEGVYGMDTEGRCTFLNHAAAQMLGWEPAELLGRPLHPLIHHTRVDGSPYPVGECRIMQAFERGVPCRVAGEVFWRKEGTPFEVEYSSSPLTEDGVTRGAVVIFIDVSTRKRQEALIHEAEARKGAIMSAALDAILMMNASGKVIDCNPAATAIFGHPRADFVGRDMAEMIIPERYRAAHRKGLSKFLETGTGPILDQRIEISACRANGEEFPVELTVTQSRLEGAPMFVGFIRDITERKAAEEELRTSREEFKMLGEAIPPQVWTAAPDGSLLYVNQRALQFFGCPLEQLQGLSPAQTVHPDDAAEVTAQWQRALATGEPYQQEFRLRRHDGVFVWHVSNAAAQRNERGEVVKWFGTTTDISERHAAVEELDAKREELQMLSEAIPQQVWTARPDGTLDYVNQRVLEYFGAHFPRLIGSGWKAVVHPEDLPVAAERWQCSLITGDPYEVEFRLKRGEDNAYRWHLGRALAVRSGRAVVKWFGTNTDITERKTIEEQRDRALHAERALRAAEKVNVERSTLLARASALLSASLDNETTLRNVAELTVLERGIADWCLIDFLQEDGALQPVAIAHSALVSASAAGLMRGLYPLRAEHQIGGSDVLTTGQPKLLTILHHGLLPTWARDAAHLEFLTSLELRSAMVLPLTARGQTFGTLSLLSAQPSREYHAEDLTFAEDLAGRAALSVENARLLREARQANLAKDHFLAVLSHELRTPLNPVLMAASAMERDATIPAELRADLAMIRRNVELEARLIDDLLDLTRVANGKLQLQLQLVDAHELVRQAWQIVESDTSLEKPQLGLELDAGHFQIKADPARLQQIFWNVIKNAVKFTPATGKVHIRSLNPAPLLWRLEVQDTGKGISRESLPHIFKAFEQGGSMVAQQFGGLGLGLAISRALAELHGAALSAASAGLERGATFTFDIACDASPVPRVSPAAAPVLERKRQLRILLVEDHETTGTLMKRLLVRRGHSPELARSKAEALSFAARERFDVVVSDLGLPDGTGFELMHELSTTRGLLGIALSGYGMEADMRRSRESGFYAHLTKPIDVEQLEQALQEMPLTRHE